jgi:hypothetical protein
LIGQYAHGNEPSHHIAYLYDYAGEPWKTQEMVRRIMDEFYKPTPDGLIGNEDCGQMSAWYVFSALGFYPVVPGAPEYALGTPLFKEAKIRFENGKVFIIRAPNVSEKNIYVKSVRSDTFFRHKEAYLSHRQLSVSMPGEMGKFATLEFEMSDVPQKDAFDKFPSSTRENYPTSEMNFVAVPVIESGGRVFKSQTMVTLKPTSPNLKLFYTTDGSDPNLSSSEYKMPLSIDKSTQIKAIAVNPKGVKSQAVEAEFLKRPNDWTVSIAAKYNLQYTGGGDEGLIDGLRGTTNFASGAWQGYQGQDFVATVDMQRVSEITKVGGGFLQNAGSWIWMPTHIEVETSIDGVNFAKVADIKTDIAPDDMESKVRDYVQTISPVRARYIRVHAYNLGKIPAWHPGAGNDAFIFVDEIIIE